MKTLKSYNISALESVQSVLIRELSSKAEYYIGFSPIFIEFI